MLPDASQSNARLPNPRLVAKPAVGKGRHHQPGAAAQQHAEQIDPAGPAVDFARAQPEAGEELEGAQAQRQHTPADVGDDHGEMGQIYFALLRKEHHRVERKVAADQQDNGQRQKCHDPPTNLFPPVACQHGKPSIIC
jgi:hypothetical protein